jgi:hypothetical protein
LPALYGAGSKTLWTLRKEADPMVRRRRCPNPFWLDRPYFVTVTD